MFLARDDRGQVLNLLEEQDVTRGNFSCPSCGNPVRFKQGKVMRPHFAHVSLEDCQGYAENESAEHLELKASLFRWARKGHLVQVEAALPELKQIADLLVGDKLALEVQCSPLSKDRLAERTQTYQAAGYQVLWLLGEKLWLGESITKLQRDFLYFSQGLGFFLWELDLNKQQLRLKYLIHEDLHGQVQYKSKIFPFEEGDLLEVLRLPFQQKGVASFLAKSDRQICRYVRQQLYFRSAKWMRLQEQLYQLGDNLLTKQAQDFYPQVRPIEASYFCQIQQDLTSYYENFKRYYAETLNKEVQIVYSPAFYKHYFKKLETE